MRAAQVTLMRAPEAMPSRVVLHMVFDVLMAAACAVLFGVLFLFAWALLLSVEGGGASVQTRLQNPSVYVQLAMSGFMLAPTALLLYLWRRPATRSERARSWQRARQPSTWAWGAGTGVVLFVAVTSAAWVVERLGVDATPSNYAMIKHALRSQPWAVIAFAVVLAPVYEEVLFRRVLFGRLWAAGRPGLGMLLSGAAFALFHEPPMLVDHGAAEMAVLWSAYALIGIALAWVYRRTGTLWAAVLAHAVNNALGCTFALAFTPG